LNCKSKYYYFFIIAFFCPLILISQNTYHRVFESIYDDIPQCVIATPDSGYLISGYTEKNSNDWSIYLLKFDSSGNEQWRKEYNGYNKDLLHDVKLTGDNGYLICGRTWSYLTQGGDAFILKVDENGNQVFANVFDGHSTNWYNAGQSACELNNGEFIEVGSYHMLNNPVRYDWEVNRFDVNGNLIDSYTIGLLNGDDKAADVISHNANEFIAIGSTDTSSTGLDFALYHGDNNGNVLAFKNYTSPGDDQPKKIISNSDGTFYIAGYGEQNGSGMNDFKVIKLDNNFSVLWSNSYGSSGDETLYGACQNGQNGLVLCGQTTGFNVQGTEMIAIEIDENGNVLNSILIGGNGNQCAFSVAKDTYGNYIVHGQTDNWQNTGHKHFTVTYLDSNFDNTCDFQTASISSNSNPINTISSYISSSSIPYEAITNIAQYQPTHVLNSFVPNITLSVNGVDSISDQLVCLNDTILLYANNPNQATISWSNSILDSIPFVFTESFASYVLTASAYQCSFFDTVNVTSEPAIFPSFTLSDSLGCAPKTIFLQNTTDTSQFNNNSWNFGNGYHISSGNDTSFTFVNPGCYDISLQITSNNECLYDTTMASLICLYEIPIANFSYTPSNPTFNDSTFSFVNNSQFSDFFYWIFNDTDTSTLTNPIYNSSLFNDIEVQLIAYSNYGCSDTTSQVIQIGSNAFFVPNAFSPDGDGINEVFQISPTDVQSISEFDFLIFNRWGEVIFKSDDTNIGWNGDHSGKQCKSGLYVWKINYIDHNNVYKDLYGSVHLIR
jgi:gliding motility-associated-like protein